MGDYGPQPLKIGDVTLGNTPLIHKCYHDKFGRSGSNDWYVITEILRKSLILRVLPFNTTL